MAKTSKSIDSVDAGTLDGKLYDRALDPLRAKMRRALLPLVRAETPVLAAIQKRIRTPWWDAYFLWTANLGTHTFFMIFLPIIIWFANAELGRGVACLTAAGVFWSGFIKDFMCLPRPLSPPVHRLSMSSSVALEYGFPSTHATNSVSVGLYLFAVSCDTFAPESTARMVCVASCAVYVASVVLGRLYCGMHSLTDVVGGTILAYALYWTQWTFRAEFDSLFTDDGYWVFLTIPLFLSLVGIHPDPLERCPCFEDSVCFMGVLIGLFPGSWLCQHTDICVMSLTSTATQQTGLKAGLIVLLKMVLGVSVLFVWRMACKKACYVILPPIYRAFNLPHRKFEIGARYYKSLKSESIHPIPSVLDLRGLTSSMAESDHVGMQSPIDLHERRVAEAKQCHNRKGRELDEKVPEEDISDDEPLRYDIDIVTKLIVYAGIGFLAVYPVPLLFQLLFGASS
ncbi:hypothetical protein PHYBLDRAFT_189030 [Phycomyces blakesleeanus NRRL 1555(-)]|uniref:Phosphatidic acid phosphatase type 2/haloperoxidase domain-containing protein n=1 Tax=Phycomyces blakesleeanus (strain ATCC 8743b / DSM 1359 / FGSC 10004 / NBRC 33097 / NRRL 1555) TaxID=763407 RepID=A0A167K9R4_PHYB8|nr:hypothetical protein PHYBLDRAFT_189030 [Phycomyces blakesleeanus NRRL 1555(-)]OAD67557.1 hypothetical protein PHYBLDRAFT_189030 [Phycomyces blakesleeanus NRRL 1555(-)]|eukprot:XP_018285597.1 hypothetical protein PHYBLDRAFT_189030 [Phycomyces blakesleeanus NRRL 1555(-)]